MSITGYVVVYTSSSAFKSEKLLKRAGINVKLVPTPRHISSDCGISAYFETESEKLVRETLDAGDVEYFIAGVKTIES